jgi:two-component system, chemotaxis family, sensor kinase CheA
MNGLNEQFISEARELIHQATEDLIAWEREGAADRVHGIFRVFHTLKGAAGVVQLQPMSQSLHAAEDMMAALQTGRLSGSPHVIGAALECLDLVSQWVDEFEAKGALSWAAAEDGRAIAERLRALMAEDRNAPLDPHDQHSDISGKRADGKLPEVDNDVPVWALELAKSEQARLIQLKPSPAALFAICYEPRPDCFFDGDDPLLVMKQIPDLISLGIEPREPWPRLPEFDPFSCNLRLLAISAGSRTDLANVFRLLPDQVRIVQIPPQFAGSRRGNISPASDLDSLKLTILNEQREMLLAAEPGEDFSGRVGSIARVTLNILGSSLAPEIAERIKAAAAVALAANQAAPLRAMLEELISLLATPLPAEVVEPAAVVHGPSAESDGMGRASRSLRVDEAKIDALVNLAGEFLTAKNSLTRLVKRMEVELPGHELTQSAKLSQDMVARLATETQAAAMQLRMVPIDQVFRSFPRLVRDMSQRLGKEINLLTRGGTTECDKVIVDRLFEPLLHLLRNALDHGVENPDQRRAAGKPEQAVITMQASRAGERLVIDVIDDGRGIDVAAVGRKARDRGLVTDDEFAAMSEQQVIGLIFSAGFSTAAELSDISGRGVGMDVVRNAIEHMGGRIRIATISGKGTTVTLDLPSSIALSRIMVIDLGGQQFGVSMDSVNETLRITSDRIRRVKNNLGFVLRDRVVPIRDLRELMNLPPVGEADSGTKLLLLTDVAGGLIALEVDEVLDQFEAVLKPMQGLLANARGYQGTTLLADGSVLLVLNLRDIVA